MLDQPSTAGPKRLSLWAWLYLLLFIGFVLLSVFRYLTEGLTSAALRFVLALAWLALFYLETRKRA